MGTPGGWIADAPEATQVRSGGLQRGRRQNERLLGRVRAILGGAVDDVAVRTPEITPRLVGDIGLGARGAPDREELVVQLGGGHRDRAGTPPRPAQTTTFNRACGDAPASCR